jgi:hypothetical protein
MKRPLQFYLDDLSGNYCRYMPLAIKEQVNRSTPNCHGGLRERLYWLRNNIDEYPLCACCNKKLTTRNFKKNGKAGYREFCSKKCAKLSQDYTPIISKRTITNLERYGSNNPCYFPNFREKMKEKFNTEFIIEKKDV